eukprot:4633022-Pyramimonas_sp.AAC.1
MCLSVIVFGALHPPRADHGEGDPASHQRQLSLPLQTFGGRVELFGGGAALKKGRECRAEPYLAVPHAPEEVEGSAWYPHTFGGSTEFSNNRGGAA